MMYPEASIEKRKSGRCFVALFALIGICGYLLRATHGFTAVPGDLGDARFNSIILEHIFQWLRGDSTSLWSPSFFYPYQDALAFSDNHFGSAWIYALARFARLPRELAFDFWFCIGDLLTFFTCSYAARRFGFSWFAAAVAAFVFTFSLPALAQEGHAQLIYRFAIPLAVLECWQMLEMRRLNRLPQLGIWVALQFFCSIYLGLFLVMFIGAMLVTDFFDRTPRSTAPAQPHPGHRLYQLSWWLIAALLWAGLLCMLAKYHAVAREYAFGRGTDEITSMLPRIGSYFIADHSRATAWVGSWVQGIPMRNEHQLFFGLGASILAVAGFVAGRQASRWSRLTRLFTGVLLILIAVTLSVNGLSLYRGVMILPGFNSIRAVTRVCLLMLLAVAWLAAIGVDEALRRYPGRGVTITASIVLLLSIEVVCYQTVHVPISQWRDRISSLRAEWVPARDGNKPILFAWGTSNDPWLIRELDAMMFAQDEGVPTVNGYSGNLPANFGLPDACEIGAHRLANGASFEKLPATELSDMLKRLAILPESANCRDYAHLKPFEGALPDSVFQHVAIAMVGQTKTGMGYEVIVKISNASDQYLPALSTSNNPVQLSWQFVPYGHSPDMNAWNTRVPLSDDVPERASLDQKVSVQLPSRPGRYQIVFSVVQDGVSWFHDKGMSVAVGETAIEVPDK